MSEAMRPVDESDLHAYVDGQLQAERRQAVELHLARSPEAAERVAAYGAQREALRAAFAARTEPVPPHLKLASIMAQRARRRAPPWLLAASVVLALGIGGTAGWLLHGPARVSRTQQAMLLLEEEALASHVVYAGDRRHPVEVSGAEEPHLKQWLSNRLERRVAPPDLTGLGYHLIGGRLLATERGGTAALFMYDDASGKRLSLLLRPMARELHASRTDIQRNGLNGCAWIADGLGVAVVAPLPDSTLDQVAGKISGDLADAG
jgi:anti-sigma factor RsiW